MSTVPDTSSWYKQHAPTHEGLATVVATTLSNLLKTKRIDRLAVSSRVKTLDSVLEKMARKEYASPTEITDLTGIRVITYIESDVQKVAELIEGAFKMDATKSINKSDELRTDRFGYRSVHYVCELGESRTNLTELSDYKGVLFEIQVRTVLQHAWAEIEHDRSYKFAGDLPSSIRRRLNLVAGLLEVADREFSSLAHEVDLYAKEIHETAQAGNLATAEITSISVAEYLKSRHDLSALDMKEKSKHLLLDTAILEWKAFGLKTIDDLDRLLTTELVATLMRDAPPTTYVGLARRSMLYADMTRYFATVFKKQWSGMHSSVLKLLDTKYGVALVDKTLASQGLTPKRDTTSPKKSVVPVK